MSQRVRLDTDVSRFVTRTITQRFVHQARQGIRGARVKHKEAAS